jgi:hypothetical protein
VVAHAALVIQAFSPVRVYLPSAHAPLSDDGRHLHQAPPGGRGGVGDTHSARSRRPLHHHHQAAQHHVRQGEREGGSVFYCDPSAESSARVVSAKASLPEPGSERQKEPTVSAANLGR